ncbi:MAG: hypothetical protein AABX66_00700 [Nanoarchaeota archaeon]
MKMADRLELYLIIGKDGQPIFGKPFVLNERESERVVKELRPILEELNFARAESERYARSHIVY